MSNRGCVNKLGNTKCIFPISKPVPFLQTSLNLSVLLFLPEKRALFLWDTQLSGPSLGGVEVLGLRAALGLSNPHFCCQTAKFLRIPCQEATSAPLGCSPSALPQRVTLPSAFSVSFLSCFSSPAFSDSGSRQLCC